MKDPLNPNSKPSRALRSQNSGGENNTPPEDQNNQTEPNRVPGTDLDLDDYDEALKMKRKMVDELDDDENKCEMKTAYEKNIQTYTLG